MFDKRSNWIRTKELPDNVPITFKVMSVEKTNDEDMVFTMVCEVLTGEFKGKTTKIWWRKYKKDGDPRKDFANLYRYVCPDKFKAGREPKSYHFVRKIFSCIPYSWNELKFFREFVLVENAGQTD